MTAKLAIVATKAVTVHAFSVTLLTIEPFVLGSLIATSIASEPSLI